MRARTWHPQWSGRGPAATSSNEAPMAHCQPDAGAGAESSASPDEYDLVAVAEGMRLLSERMADQVHAPLQHLVATAVESVPGARWASISTLRGEQFSTAASSGEQATR